MKLNDLRCVNEEINIDEYINFRELVKNNMDYPEWLGDFSKEELINMQNDNSKIWIYYFNDEPVCSMMMIPSTEKSLNKFEIDLKYKEVVDYGPMFVNPKYVGNGLQYQMLKELNNYCEILGYKYAVSTIHPDNIYSINNLMKDNFVKIDQKNFKRGIRNIYLKCLDSNYVQKVLSFIKKDEKYLLLKGSESDPQFHESFWYVVTGSVEKEDLSLKEAAKREIYEETGLRTSKIKKIPIIFEYESLGNKCIEHLFIAKVEDEKIVLNEENIDYKWCDIDEFINKIKWYYDKEQLKNMIKNM